jgi:hypothetical protein
MSTNTASQSTFNIGTISADEVSMAGRDTYIARGTLTSLGAARLAAESLRQAFASTQSRELAAMRGPVDAIAAEMQQPTPNRRTVADRVRTLIELINASASAASLGVAIIDPLRRLAEWLGDLGAPILHMLV